MQTFRRELRIPNNALDDDCRALFIAAHLGSKGLEAFKEIQALPEKIETHLLVWKKTQAPMSATAWREVTDAFVSSGLVAKDFASEAMMTAILKKVPTTSQTPKNLAKLYVALFQPNLADLLEADFEWEQNTTKKAILEIRSDPSFKNEKPSLFLVKKILNMF
jgi:hypothetical protein